MAHLASGTLGAVAAGDSRAAAAAMGAFAQGGSAIDAVIAGALTQWVVMPDMCGPGGDLFALIARGPHVSSINASGPAPESILTGGNRMDVTIPGALHGLYALHSMGGRLPIEHALDAAAQLATRGFVISKSLSWQFRNVAKGRLREDLMKQWNSVVIEGRVATWPAMATTLRALATDGLDGFVTGRLGKRTAAEWASHGCHIEPSAWRDVRPDCSPPLEIEVDGWKVSVNPPVSQGVLLQAALGAMGPEARDELARGSGVGIHLAVEATKLAFGEQNRVFDGGRLECEELLSGKVLREMRRQIGPKAQCGRPIRAGYGDTTHLAAVDAEGCLTSLIHSLYQPFGAGVIAPSTGLIMNNRGSCFDSGDNALAVGRRPRHTLTNVVATSEFGGRLAMGTPGANAQVQTNLQVLNALMRLPVDRWVEAVDAPRWTFWGEGDVAVEDGVPQPVLDSLAERGHRLVARPGHDWFCGAVGIVGETPNGILAIQDPRREGIALAL